MLSKSVCMQIFNFTVENTDPRLHHWWSKSETNYHNLFGSGSHTENGILIYFNFFLKFLVNPLSSTSYVFVSLVVGINNATAATAAAVAVVVHHNNWWWFLTRQDYATSHDTVLLPSVLFLKNFIFFSLLHLFFSVLCFGAQKFCLQACTG